MKNIIKNISRVCLIMAGTAVLLSGCSEDFLATDPLSFYEPGGNVLYGIWVEGGNGYLRSSLEVVLRLRSQRDVADGN